MQTYTSAGVFINQSIADIVVLTNDSCQTMTGYYHSFTATCGETYEMFAEHVADVLLKMHELIYGK